MLCMQLYGGIVKGSLGRPPKCVPCPATEVE